MTGAAARVRERLPGDRHEPEVVAAGLQGLRTAVLANARAAGVSVRLARVLPVGGGVLSVVAQLRKDQLFEARAQAALDTLFGPATTKPGALHFVSIEAPDGTANARSVEIGGVFAGHRVSRSYNGCYGATGLRWARFLGA